MSPVRVEPGCNPVERPKADQAELALHLRERLANYKVPKAITIVDRLPILANGKVDRKQLSAIAQKVYDGSR